MKLRNHATGYGLIGIVLHWSMAVLIVGLFALGVYMVTLGYYDPWYQMAPHLHRSFGVITAFLLLLRWLWRISNPTPELLGETWEQFIALLVHRAFYLLIAGIVISGYLITTAKGQPVSVFDWFELPATFTGFEDQEDIAGKIHRWLAYSMIVLVVLHSLAALKHHLIDGDETLRRMLHPGGHKPD